jgi:hypothetical protein
MADLQQLDAKIPGIQPGGGANHLEIFFAIKEKFLRFARKVPLRQSAMAFRSTAAHKRRAEIGSSVTVLCGSLLTGAVMVAICPLRSTRFFSPPA